MNSPLRLHFPYSHGSYLAVLMHEAVLGGGIVACIFIAISYRSIDLKVVVSGKYKGTVKDLRAVTIRVRRGSTEISDIRQHVLPGKYTLSTLLPFSPK